MSSEDEKHAVGEGGQYQEADDVDLMTLHEDRAGRLVVDPEEARIEFGPKVASRLKLSRDGTQVLWPQPTDDPLDPQNWSDFKKNYHLLIITMAAIIPDFDSGVGIAAIFALAKEYNTTTAIINNLTSNWSIFLLGWGGILAVMLMKRYGRLPVLFWTQLLSLGFLIGCTFAPNLKTFAGMRCLTAFFGTCPQVTGLFVVTDLFPFHMQARKLNLWTFGFIVSPFLSPFAFGFLVARASWRWAYGIASIYSAIVLVLIIFFLEETIYDRTIKPIPQRPYGGKGFAYRFNTLMGFTGLKMAKYRIPLAQSIMDPLIVVMKPHMLLLLLYEAAVFGFGIGINVTFAVFLGEPVAIGGYGFPQFAIAGCYATPIIGALIGEALGHFVNDSIAARLIRRNKGVFEPEMRLWTLYIGAPLYVIGFIVIGAAFQNHLSIGALVIGWGLAEVAIMMTTVACYAYANNCFPRYQGEISGLINLARTLGGFSTAYFQIPWAEKHGALQTFGVEAAVVAALFLLVVPTLQIAGPSLRAKYSLH